MLLIETRIDRLCPTRSAIYNENPSIDDEIKDLTTHVQEHVEKLLSTLNARASLLLKAERRELALNDALAMMCIAPSSPLGSLCASGIETLRGQYASAIKLYGYGLKKVPRSHPQYEQLVKARAAAEDMNNKRIDFISKLPLDIVTQNIVPRLLQNETTIHVENPSSYFDVCRTWRQRMAAANGLDFEIGPEDLSVEGFLRVWDMAPFLRSLTVMQPYEEFLSKITKRRGNFRMLKKLHIYESIERGYDLLLSSLRSLSNTLTELEIEYGHRTTPKQRYRLCDLVDACPNLVSIRVDSGDIDMSSVTKTYPNLKKLELSTKDPEVNEGNIPSLLRPFPQLRALKLLPVSGSEIFSAIDQHCPLLQHLILSNGPVQFPDIVDMPAKRGLRALSVPTSGRLGDFKEGDMVQYVMKHSETIEVFDVGKSFGYYAPIGSLQQEARQQATFRQLRQIAYPFDAEEGLVTFILWMMQRAPHLESIETVAGPQQTRIMQELLKPTHSNLKRLGMQASPSILEDEKRLIQHHLDLGQQSNLTEMKIELSKDLLDQPSFISMIPGLTQLTKLELYTISGCPLRFWKSTLEQLATGCPALEQLTVTTTKRSETVFLSEICYVSSHPNLKRIIIDATEVCGDALEFCELFPNLESLHLNVESYTLDDFDCLDEAPFKFVFTQKKPERLLLLF
ncbi:hypothetical protein O0I10_006630 [Lichtheimia ornata]|uniref:F-box domain-containing protein n=1 Tax=Lichtheimia ornata TaxID=688661 RepID=A0AAD7V4N2_9FUNG|nr:uncharacterized protein O0I10_006630 [Lichtheimia ornata]KAJ8657566.1 hypothetical protein O0I10_006630 [Lichtheimia ornata]